MNIRPKLLLATTNAGKIREISEMLSDLPVQIVSLKEAGITKTVEETGTTIYENAVLKAREYARLSGLLTMADDSGIEVDALGGEPGVHSARFAGEHASDEERNRYLLEKLRHVPAGKRGGRFRCVVAIATPDLRVETSEGTVEGQIAFSPQGQNGFGYDPILYVPELGKHMGELAPEHKNRISHRGQATAAARPILARLLRQPV